MQTVSFSVPGINADHLAVGAMLATLALMTIAMMTPEVSAGTGGDQFENLYTTLTSWMTGYLGRVIAVVFIIIGVIAGAGKSIMGFVLGIAAGVGMFLAPAVIDSTVTATLPMIVVL